MVRHAKTANSELYQIRFEFAVTHDPEPPALARTKLQVPFTPATKIGILQLELVLQ